MNVYIFHIIIAKVLKVFITHFDFAQNDIYLAIRPIFVVFFTLLLSLAIYRIKIVFFLQPIKMTITNTILRCKSVEANALVEGDE